MSVADDLRPVGSLTINSLFELGVSRWYLIEKGLENRSVLIQTIDGKESKIIPETTIVLLIAEVQLPKVRGFESVSLEGIKKTFEAYHHKGFIVPETSILPLQGTMGSCGYDIPTPISIHIPAKGTIKFFTNIKAYMQPGEMLLVGVRSHVGIEDEVVLGETLTFIDPDYYNNARNEGNIAIVLRNTSDKMVRYNYSDRICQAVFVPFLRADNCNTTVLRDGGLGSTGR